MNRSRFLVLTAPFSHKIPREVCQTGWIVYSDSCALQSVLNRRNLCRYIRERASKNFLEFCGPIEQFRNVPTVWQAAKPCLRKVAQGEGWIEHDLGPCAGNPSEISHQLDWNAFTWYPIGRANETVAPSLLSPKPTSFFAHTFEQIARHIFFSIVRRSYVLFILLVGWQESKAT